MADMSRFELERITAPSQEEFERRYLKPGRPVLIAGVVDKWPAASLWNPDQLVAQLSKMREALNQNNQPTDKIQVIINPGRQTKYRHLIDVYQAALRSDFSKVSFSTAH